MRAKMGWLASVFILVSAFAANVSAEPRLGESLSATPAAVKSADYRQGFLDGYRARSGAHRDRRSAFPGWSRPLVPRDYSAPYWRNRPRSWPRPRDFARRRDGDEPQGSFGARQNEPRWVAERRVVGGDLSDLGQVRPVD